MSKKEQSDKIKALCAEFKKRDAEGVGETSNATQWYKFVQKTEATLATFDKESPSYVDYAQRAIKPKKQKDADAEKPAKEAKKAKRDKEEAEPAGGKATKKAKAS